METEEQFKAAVTVIKGLPKGGKFCNKRSWESVRGSSKSEMRIPITWE